MECHIDAWANPVNVSSGDIMIVGPPVVTVVIPSTDIGH